MNLAQIYIVGAGAIGKTLAVLLVNEGRKVTLLRRPTDNENHSPLLIQLNISDERILTAEVPVISLSSKEILDGIVVIATKSFANTEIAASLFRRAGNSPVVIMQNGLNVEQPFIDAGFKNIYRCVLFATSANMDDNTVRYKAVVPSPIGIIKGDGADLEPIVLQLTTNAFAFRSEPSIADFIWKKTIINSVFNSVCPLLDCDNGIFHRNVQAMEIAKSVINEGVSIAQASGIHLRQSDVESTLLDISCRSDGQLISTLQDIHNGRPTEIDSMNVEIVRIAEKLNKAGIVIHTNLLGQLTRLKAAFNR